MACTSIGLPSQTGYHPALVGGRGGVSFPHGQQLLLPQHSITAPDWYGLTRQAIIPLQHWYNAHGLWNTTGWWNAANCLTTLENYALIDPSSREGVALIAANTFKRAADADFYDDQGWWAMAWIRAFDLTGSLDYLNTAVYLFEDMVQGYTAPCGGIWWDKAHRSQVAIANELFMEVAASLANRADHLGGSQRYLDWARKSWVWLKNSGLINEELTINDGLDPATCTNNHDVVWSYNQGVILGALVELSRAESDTSLLIFAAQLAHAAILALSDENGVLHDVCEPACGLDGTQFKGIFVRGLSALHKAAPDQTFAEFIRINAEAIKQSNKNVAGEFSVIWSGPPVNPANASTHCSAMDALVAAAALDPSALTRPRLAKHRE